MHLAGNLSDLLLALWHGTIDCGTSDNENTWEWAVFQDDHTWTVHGNAVDAAGPYLPGSFDRKPHNIAEKLNTGYKTWEFQLYTFGLGPALLYNVLPKKYWIHHCQLIIYLRRHRAFQLMCQYQISSEDLQHAHTLFCTWERDFELYYYQQKEDRIHFVRPCVHQMSHIVSETLRKGPPICYAQWMMERTIGNLGQEICQPSNPYANLSQEGVRRCKVNTLLSVIPELDEPPNGLPDGAVDLGGGYALLHKRDKTSKHPVGEYAHAITTFLGDRPLPHIKRWA
ncbi:hypothetical protein BDR07DRAFT_1305291 [Suillus spraguei]|nr:hypothetical protein BDR07DRAFT_1305291 [Suillus spraguei]